MKNSLVQRVQRLEGEISHDDNFQDICAENLAWIQAITRKCYSPEELTRMRQDLRESIAAQGVPISGMTKIYSMIYDIDQDGENHGTQPNK